MYTISCNKCEIYKFAVLFVIVLNMHNDYTKITQPHELFLNPMESTHKLRYLGCGWVDAYDDVLKQVKDSDEFQNFVTSVNPKLEQEFIEHQALTLLLRGRRDENFDVKLFDHLRHQCLHILWKSLANCNILSLYLDGDSMDKAPDEESKYIVSAFQNNNIPSMLHCSLEKRLVEQQIEKFKVFHREYYKQTTYANAGWNNPERQALLTTQRLFYVDMILNKIELAKWSLNEMWGSKAMDNAAEKAYVDKAIITGEGLHKLSIEMLRCATSWLIFARHYSAEMDRMKDKPDEKKQSNEQKEGIQATQKATQMQPMEPSQYQRAQQAKYKTNSRQFTRKSSWKRR